MSRFRVENKMIPGNDKLRRLLRLNRTIITALADRRVSHWRQTMQDLGLGLDWDPVVVQRGEIFYRSSFNENTKSYEVGHFTAEQHKGYFINSSIGKGLSGVEDWETQTRHVEWHRCINCAIWKPPPLLVFDTEIPILGKGLLALQVCHLITQKVLWLMFRPLTKVIILPNMRESTRLRIVWGQPTKIDYASKRVRAFSISFKIINVSDHLLHIL